MKILANENIPIKSVYFLREAGYNVKAISEHNFGIIDKAVMKMAILEERMIITFDRDYGELIFKHNFKPSQGVLYLRLDSYEPDEPGKIVHDLISKNEVIFENSLTVLDNLGIRQKKY